MQVSAIALIATAASVGLLAQPTRGLNALFCGGVLLASAGGLGGLLSGRPSFCAWVAENLTKFALIGTVTGFIQALSYIDPGVPADAAVINGVLTGMGLALWVTLFGLVGNLWLRLNLRLFA